MPTDPTITDPLDAVEARAAKAEADADEALAELEQQKTIALGHFTTTTERAVQLDEAYGREACAALAEHAAARVTPSDRTGGQLPGQAAPAINVWGYDNDQDGPMQIINVKGGEDHEGRSRLRPDDIAPVANSASAAGARFGNRNEEMMDCYQFGTVPARPAPAPDEALREMADTLLAQIWGMGDSQRGLYGAKAILAALTAAAVAERDRSELAALRMRDEYAEGLDIWYRLNSLAATIRGGNHGE